MTETEAASLSDEDLIKVITDQNQELFALIVKRYESPLMRYVQTMIYDYPSSQDVVQQTLIKAFTNLRGFNIRKKFSSWIYRIAHNEAINFLKKHKKEFHPDDEAWFDKIASNQKSIEEIVDAKAQKQEIYKAITALPVKYREPLLLNVYQDKKYSEIGDILRIPTATVGTRIKRAKNMLEKSLKGQDE